MPIRCDHSVVQQLLLASRRLMQKVKKDIIEAQDVNRALFWVLEHFGHFAFELNASPIVKPFFS